MKRRSLFVVIALLFSSLVQAQDSPPAAPTPNKAKQGDSFEIQGSLRSLFSNMQEQIAIPGFITTKPLPSIATITGPLRAFNSYMISEKIYLRWQGSPAPRIDDYYAIYTPAILMQNRYDTTDFKVIVDKGEGQQLPEKYRVAGYFYEPNGEAKITGIARGIVTAIITHASKQINLGDELMLPMPQFDNIQPIVGGLQLNATIVVGSPPERISPTLGAFFYINRGSKDGVKIGRVFEVTEQVPLADNPLVAPTESLGEAKVVYTTDYYSTVLVTKQFNAIRLGGILQTKAENVAAHNPQEKFIVRPRNSSKSEKQAVATPTPKKQLSELDELERRAGVMNLTPEERARLNSLQQQSVQKKDEAGLAENAEVPSLPAAPKGGSNDKGNTTTKKKDTKKKKSGQDEEGLNELMQY